jgi:hypothetical protein
MSRDQMFSDEEARFKALWGPIALELGGHALAVVDDRTDRSASMTFHGRPIKTMPSREFVVRQACLNAVAKEMPNCVDADGAASVYRYLTDKCWWDGKPPTRWLNLIRAEFRALEAQYHA